ncbi:hypothetical protein LAG90_12055 [Marinilongibacter aquaticus]|uniref:imm11 family protein n=1 Tax=Marinilongibacter aquaticus TaxID=2975157 RepID=UPI0021BD0A4F|nr:hypothetical protein [Marinilongibacter aquaticus]UBM57551.1 hypothetical protein LAG90_12055 [Marinilongibacter aquaticus]
MKYLLTKYVFKRSITGSDWQIRPAPKGADRNWFNKPTNYTQIKFDEFPDFIPDAYFELDEKGKFTDIIRISNTHAKGFLVSPRVRELWNDFILLDHQYYPATVVAESGEKRDYFLFHMAAQDIKGLDYEKSVFNDCKQLIQTNDDGSQVFVETKIGRLIERILPTKPPRSLALKKLYFDEKFPGYDLFYIPFFMVLEDFFISERLATVMQREKMTGLVFEEQSIIDEF